MEEQGIATVRVCVDANGRLRPLPRLDRRRAARHFLLFVPRSVPAQELASAALSCLYPFYGANPDDHSGADCEQRSVKQKAPKGEPFICFDAYIPFIISVGSTFSSK